MECPRPPDTTTHAADSATGDINAFTRLLSLEINRFIFQLFYKIIWFLAVIIPVGVQGNLEVSLLNVGLIFIFAAAIYEKPVFQD